MIDRDHLADRDVPALRSGIGDGAVTGLVVGDAVLPLIGVQEGAVAMKAKALQEEALALVPRQPVAEGLGKGNEGVAIAADEPGAAEIEPLPRRYLLRVGPAADPVRSFDDVIAEAKPCQFLRG